MAKILLAEDEVNIASFIERGLKEFRHSVTVCHDGNTGWRILQEEPFDLVILDIIMPKINGLELCHLYRQMFGYQTPVIMLTALGTTEDIVKGLDAGADDYLVKPFAFEELMARIRCICRRPQRLTDQHMTWHDLSFDPEQSMLSCGDRRCSLSRREGALLSLFLTHPEQTLPRETILLRIWGEESDVESGNLDNYIHFLRRRLKTVGSQAQLVTARGVGYRLTDI